jgi:thiol-disulfide isomerase/thioredoxin
MRLLPVIRWICQHAVAVTVVVEPASIDLGSIPFGQEKSMPVMLRNTGTSPVKVVTAAGNCACTTSTWPTEPIEPGATAEAVVTLKPSESQRGERLTKKVTFVIEGQGVVDLAVVASVPADAGAPPAPAGPGTPAAQPTTPARPATPLPPKPSTAFTRVDPPMKPGVRAPFPTFDHWIIGAPEQSWAPGVVYVIDFFGTDCSHCREYATLIEQVMRDFGARGVRFIATTDEQPEAVRAWYGKAGVADHFPCAITADPDRSVLAAFQHGTFRTSTPRFFIVKDGIVQWYGHPKVSRPVLEALLAGTWDPRTELADAVTESNVARAKNVTDTMVRWCDRSGDWQPLLETLDNVRAAIPERAGQYESQRFLIMIGLAKQAEQGYAFGRAVAKARAGELETLRAMARAILETPFVKVRDLDFAMELALAADALAKGEDARAADTVALANYAKGNREAAVANGERAVRLETDPSMKRKYEQALQKYRTGPMGPEPSKDHEPAPADAPATPPRRGASRPAAGS